MRRWQEMALLLSADIAACVLAFAVALWFRQAATLEALVFPVGAYVLPGDLLASAWVALYAYIGLYDDGWSRKSRLDELMWLAKTVFLGVVILFIATFDPSRPFALTRVVILSYGFTLIGVSGAGRLLARGIQRRLFQKGIGLQNALLVGAGEAASRLRASMDRHGRLGYRIAGCLTTAESVGPDASADVIGTLDDLPDRIVEHSVSEVMFAEPELSHDRILEAVAKCNGLRVGFSVVPDLYDVIVGRSALGQIYGIPLMPLFASTMSVWQRRTKRVVDVVVSAVALVAGAPIWATLAAIIWLQDRHPAVYSQERVGCEGRTFNVHKFRSMVPDAEKKSGPVWASKGDPRITSIGRLLRKTRLDEVPQLWNVVRGEMSLVGPRPERPYFVNKLALEIPLYRRRLHVKPGVTGWAQTKLAYDETIDDVREKLKHDLYYVENMSLRLDMIILARTVWVVIAGRGAQ